MTVYLPFAVCRAVRRLTKRGFSVWLVGGCIRALLTGTQPYDFDLATDAWPQQLLDVFSDCKVNKAGMKHGTIMVIIGQKPVEITTLRIEGTYSDRRRPDQVHFTDQIESDLARRDFTINAMAWLVPADCIREGTGLPVQLQQDQLIDPYHGQADLAAGRIRCVGQAAERFAEDALRILRALRLAATLGFAIEAQTAAAMRCCAVHLRIIAIERIHAELIRIINGGFAADVLLDYWDILVVILPECSDLLHNQKDRKKAADRLRRVPADFPLRLAALLLSCSHPVQPLLDRLRYSKAIQRRAVQILACAQDMPDAAEPLVLKWLRRYSPAIVYDAMQLIQADTLAGTEADKNKLNQVVRMEKTVNQVLDEGRCYRLQDLAINGSDLLQLGLPAGRQVGQTLSRLLDRVIEGQLNNEKAALLRAAAAEIELTHDHST